uniref:Protein PHYTOCHROME KINASE SUBSTRATE 4-like n=1 Tax=Cicer arietinum TaxID=3827 RepID=A0A1S2XJQ2_CICAR|nr:protein PHYTOCHROME KINASE SUBSTRATE 4-like [Cicer arietinum]
MEREIHDNMNPNSPIKRNKKEPCGECIVLDHDSNSNEETNNNDLLQKMTINKDHSFHASTSTTPSKSSSSTISSNSKVGLKSHPIKNNEISLSKKIKASLSQTISLLRKKCPCLDKKSLQIKDNTLKPKTSTSTPTPTPQIQTLSQNQITKSSLNHNTTPKTKLTIDDDDHKSLNEGFTFPLFLETTTSSPKPNVVLNVVHEEEEQPLDSLHVFQPTSSPKSSVMDEDLTSDGSSDLFEIEGFSTQATTTLAYPIRPTMIDCQETTTNVSCDTPLQ